jgi:hypothetical protein
MRAIERTAREDHKMVLVHEPFAAVEKAFFGFDWCIGSGFRNDPMTSNVQVKR